MSKKRTIDAFFSVPKPKKPRRSSPSSKAEHLDDNAGYSKHATYPFPIPCLTSGISTELISLPSSIGRTIADKPDLDLLYFEPYIPKQTERELFQFFRAELPFYRVEYDIKRGGVQTHIRTPRWTTVFGVDETSRFDEKGDVVDAKTGRKVTDKDYAKYAPRPIPKCLDDLRKSTEAATDCHFNFCLVNYYASGADSISYHSDDERFLGPLPAIASFSLGSRRDFLMKHKPAPSSVDGQPIPLKDMKQFKLPLASGDMMLMRGKTQANWLHSIPKRTGKNETDGGRINITFRRATVKCGTENYYNYNVGSSPLYKWDAASKEMKLWKEPQ